MNIHCIINRPGDFGIDCSILSILNNFIYHAWYFESIKALLTKSRIANLRNLSMAQNSVNGSLNRYTFDL